MPKGVYERRQRENKREDILRAATKVYAYYGFEGATLQKMAAEAGVSKALVLDYFGSKQELVKAIAGDALRRHLDKLRQIDETPEITLRGRESLIHESIKTAREEWCLILGTLLVPNFQFPMRGELGEYLNVKHRLVIDRHLDELRDPTPEAAFDYVYSTTALHHGYVLGGRQRDFRSALDRLLDLYLRPEEEIAADRTKTT